MDGPQDLEKRLLGEVLGQLAISQEAEGQAIDGLVVPLKQRVEGGNVAGQVVADEVEIRGAFRYSRRDLISTPDSAKSWSWGPSRRVAGAIIALVLAAIPALRRVISSFVTRPRFFRKSAATSPL